MKKWILSTTLVLVIAAAAVGSLQPLSAAPELTDPNETALFYVVDSPHAAKTRKITWANMVAALAGIYQAYNAGLSDIAGLSKTDGYFIVGDGSAWVAEGGGVARSSLGLGTSNNPEFGSVNVGHPSDTTVTRPSAGNLAVEGNLVYRAGGTDVPVADGGTGASTAAGARTNLGVGDANSPQFAGVRLGDYEILEDGGTLLIEDDGTPVFSVAGGYIDVATLTANVGLHAKNGSTSSGFLALHNDSDDGEEYGALSPETLTANRAWTLPDANGVILLDSDIGTTVQAYNTGLSDIAGLSKEDNVFIVGNGSAWVAEGRIAARSSLGLGTSNNPEFGSVNVGHPSDTTVTRPSAGNLAVEGNLVYRAGGTDVPVADGGTGASTAANARTNLYIDQYLDVREYGASDQDSVDDTNEIAAAYAAAAAAGKGLLIPRTHSSGYYKLMATWAIGGGAEKRGIEIVGLGHPEIRWAGGTGGTMVGIDSSLAGRYVGIWLNGNDVAGVNGVLHTGSASPNQHNTFDHIWVQNCPGVGIDVNQTDSYTVDYTDLRQCVLQGNGVNLWVRGGSRQVTLSGGANLSANSYGIRIGNGAVADGGSVYCYDYFWGGNTTSDIYIDGSISSLKVYGGSTESDCFLTNSAYAEDGSSILGPIVLDGLTQDASPAGSAIIYTGWHSISFRDCKFGGDVDISDDCAGVWSINTEFSAGDFIGACTRFTRFLPQENIHVLGGYAFQSASDGKFNLLSGSTPVLVMQADGTADVQLFTANAGLHVKNGSTSSGFLALHNDSDDGEEYGALSSETLTANRAWTLPDANGVILLDSDIGTTVQAYSASLSAWADANSAEGRLTLDAQKQHMIDVTEAPYNATGDGVTDDTAAIQAAIDAAEPNDTILLPAGTYTITTQLQMTGKDRLTLRGVGPGTTISAAGNHYVLRVTDANDVVVSDLRIVGSGNDAHESQIGVYVADCNRATLQRLVIEDMGYDGITLACSATVTTANTLIADCVIRNPGDDGINPGSSGVGGDAVACVGTIIRNCRVYGGTSTNDLIHVSFGSADTLIEGCQLVGPGEAGVAILSPQGRVTIQGGFIQGVHKGVRRRGYVAPDNEGVLHRVIVQGVQFRACSQNCIYPEGTAQGANMLIEGNWFEEGGTGASDAVIRLEGNNVTIANNHFNFTALTEYGLLISGAGAAAKFNVSGNQFLGTGYRPIHVFNSSQGLIVGNTNSVTGTSLRISGTSSGIHVVANDWAGSISDDAPAGNVVFCNRHLTNTPDSYAYNTNSSRRHIIGRSTVGASIADGEQVRIRFVPENASYIRTRVLQITVAANSGSDGSGRHAYMERIEAFTLGAEALRDRTTYTRTVSGLVPTEVWIEHTGSGTAFDLVVQHPAAHAYSLYNWAVVVQEVTGSSAPDGLIVSSAAIEAKSGSGTADSAVTVWGSLVVGVNSTTQGTLTPEELTANRTWTLPDRSGKVMLEWPAVNKTSTGNLLASESHCHIHTDGAVSNIDLTLPTAVVGMKYRVVRSAAISLRLLPYTGQNFLGQSTRVAFSFDATGTSVTIECYATGVWTVTAQFGSYSWEAY